MTGKPAYDLIPSTVINRVGARSASGVPGTDINDPFGKVSFEWLLAKMSEHLYPEYATNVLFYKGDHWQDGAGWSGPMPKQSEQDFASVKAEIEKAFISKNAVAECVRRHVSGVLGRDPTWKLASRASLVKKPAPKPVPHAGVPTPPSPSNGAKPPAQPATPPEPTPQDTARLDEEAALTDWWVKRKIHEILKATLEDGLLNGYASLRVFIPMGLLGPGSTIELPKQDIASALEYIFVHHPSPTQSGVVQNTDTMQEAGVYLFQDVEGNTHAEIAYAMGIGSEAPTMIRQLDPVATATIVNPDGTPVSTVVTPATGTGDSTEFSNQILIELGGLLPIYEIKIPILITEQVRSQQKMLNESLTMANRNIELAGFLERTILNGQMPGHYEDNPADPSGKSKRFVPDPYQVGAAAINFVNGIPSYDQQGKIIGLTNPQIVYKDPVTPDTFEQTKQMAYTGILEETRQVHYLLAAETYASGESRKQARADFFDSLVDTQGPINNMIGWLLDVVRAYAHWILKQSGPDDLRAIADTRINPGPATADTVKMAIDLYNVGGLSLPSLMEWSGVDDVAAELELIEQDRANGIMPAADKALMAAQLQTQMTLDAKAKEPVGGATGGSGANGNGRAGSTNSRNGNKPAPAK